MSNHDNPEATPTSYGYIKYPCTPDVKAIFLKDTKKTCYEIFDNGDKIACQQISKKLMALLSNQGFTFVIAPKIHSTGRKKIFGIKYSIVKYNDKNGNTIELQLVVPGTSTSDTERKINRIYNEVYSLIGVKGNVDGSKKWEEC